MFLRYWFALPLFGSVALHAAIVVTFGRGGASEMSLPATLVAPTPNAPAQSPAIELELASEPIPPPVEHSAVSMQHARSHEHAYPVADDHGAYSHDPSQDHRLHRAASDHAGSPAPHVSPHPSGDALVDPSRAPGAIAPLTTDSRGASADPQPIPMFPMSNARSNGTAQGAGAPSSADGRDGLASNAGGSSPNPMYAESAVTTPARLRTGARVVYPANASAEGIETDVALIIVVDASGRVVDASATRHEGYGFDDAAIAAIRKYTFIPATKAGQAVTVRMHWTVQFRLN
jgi:TonB family protein